MSRFVRISADDARDLIDDREVAIIDIRDPDSFTAGRMEGATHLSNETAAGFIEATAKDTPVVVCCYHGNSSQNAAQFLAEQGFSEVYSLDGGFELWNAKFPDDVESGATSPQ